MRSRLSDPAFIFALMLLAMLCATGATCEQSPPPTPHVMTVDGRVPTCDEACERWGELAGCETIGKPTAQGARCTEVCQLLEDEFPGEYRTACVVAAQTCEQALECQGREL